MLSCSSSTSDSSEEGERVYLVPYRWWKEAHDLLVLDSNGITSTTSNVVEGLLYQASSSSSSSSWSSYGYGNGSAGPLKLINNILGVSFNNTTSDTILFTLKLYHDAQLSHTSREYALVPAQLWLQALKWHTTCSTTNTDDETTANFSEDNNYIQMSDVYPLHLRLSSQTPHSLSVKIAKRDNAAELFKRACKIFTVESETLYIWDFSGQTTLFFANDKNNLTKEAQRQSDQETLLELQIYGLSDSLKCKDAKKEQMSNSSNLTGSFNGTSLLMNVSSCNTNSNSLQTIFSAVSGRTNEAGCLGLTGLQNLGNTCFMNSSLQCLAHTPKLADYFLGDYNREINHDNPLGMDGEIALAFGDLLRKLWAPGATAVAPRVFKSKLAIFAPQFNGFNQHDSQELLAFLLDGLHEDLNRVKSKPYIEAKDGDGKLDEEVGDEYWRNHLARNDSIIVDVCQGQYMSTLICPICRKVSVTFDPFMYLSLPLPSTTMRTMTLTVMSTNGGSLPLPCTITVPKYGKCEDLIKALSTTCSIRVDETLLVAEIFNNRIIRFLEEPADSLSLIRDGDRLVAYRLLKDVDKAFTVVFMHQKMGEQYIPGKLTMSWKSFGVPLVARISNNVKGSDILNLYLNLLKPFVMPGEEDYNSAEVTATTEVNLIDQQNRVNNLAKTEELLFYLTDKKGTLMDTKIGTSDPVVVMTSLPPRQVNILVSWPETLVDKYDTCMLTSLPEISKPGSYPKRTQESVSLYNCLDAFLKEEPLGPEDMWYCPECKTHRQASKKLDLWRLPEILVIHLKRFSYSRFMKNKLDTYVDFPVENLDLSTYISHKSDELLSKNYMLYAISNHYGSMGGGHYTAYVHHGGDRWYEFDDSHVYPIGEDKIKTSAAYVLFYRRQVEDNKMAD